MFKAILFDFDLILADSLDFYIDAYDKTLQTYGIKLSPKQIIDACFGKKEASIVTSLKIQTSADDFRRVYFQNKHDFLDKIGLIDGAQEILSEIKKHGLKLGIVTFAHRWYIDEMLKRLDIEKYFQTVISFNDVKNAKPHPEAVLLACKRLGVNSKETIMAGDAKNDILMGKAAGATTILYHPKIYDDVYDFEALKETKPDFIIQNLKEIKSIIF